MNGTLEQQGPLMSAFNLNHSDTVRRALDESSSGTSPLPEDERALRFSQADSRKVSRVPLQFSGHLREVAEWTR